MPRKMKKLEGMPEMPNRLDLPGAEIPSKKRPQSRGEKAEIAQAEASAAMQEGMEEDDLRAKLRDMSDEQALTSQEAAKRMLKEEKKKQFLKMNKKVDVDQARAALEPAKQRARVAREVVQEKDVQRTINKMADAIDAEPKRDTVDVEGMVKSLREAEEKRMMEEEVLGITESAPRKRSKKEQMITPSAHRADVQELIDIQAENDKREMTRKEMEELDKEWAERIKHDIEETEAKTAKLHQKNLAEAENKQKVREMVKAALAPHKEQLEKLGREEVGEKIMADVQAERAAAESDPARKRLMGKMKKLETEQASTAQRLRDLTGMEPEDAYEKLVLNAGFFGRIQRGLAALANAPTYKMLDYWHETGSKIEELNRQIMGTTPNYGQEYKARGLRNRADEELVASAAVGREDAREYRKANRMKPLDTNKVVGEISDETLMEDVNAMSEEDREIAKIDADYFTGTIRDADGNVITDEKKIRAKRPMSRVANRVQMYQGAEAAKAERAGSAMLGENVEKALREYQTERAADITIVRREYPKAAELWNGVAARLQGLDAETIGQLQNIFGTRDIGTAYVLDRAFYDMDGDQAAKARLQSADYLLGLEEIRPKKERSKPAKANNKKAA